jgi:2-iminobutanoate/2-iminopropanoate deaminase
VSVRSIATEQAPRAIGPYSQATTANGFLFSAGQIALDPATMEIVAGGIEAQTRQVMANLTAVLAQAGLAWADVVKTTVFLKSMNDFSKMNEVYQATLGAARPARSTVEVAALPRNGLVEIEVVAALRG